MAQAHTTLPFLPLRAATEATRPLDRTTGQVQGVTRASPDLAAGLQHVVCDTAARSPAGRRAASRIGDPPSRRSASSRGLENEVHALRLVNDRPDDMRLHGFLMRALACLLLVALLGVASATVAKFRWMQAALAALSVTLCAGLLFVARHRAAAADAPATSRDADLARHR